MAEFPPELVEIGESFAQRYQPVLDFEGWRVAMLRHCEHVDPAKFYRVERHNRTNEVFILTAGRADLIICAGDDAPRDPVVAPMRLNVAYNVGRAVWHHVVMTPDAHVILVERTDTAVENSDYAELSADLIRRISAQFTV